MLAEIYAVERNTSIIASGRVQSPVQYRWIASTRRHPNPESAERQIELQAKRICQKVERCFLRLSAGTHSCAGMSLQPSCRYITRRGSAKYWYICCLESIA